MTELPDPRTEPTISADRAAELLGVSRSSIYDDIKRGGTIPVIRVNGRIRIPTAAFLRDMRLEIEDDKPTPPAPLPAPAPAPDCTHRWAIFYLCVTCGQTMRDWPT